MHQVGDVLAGKYRLVRSIGKGGMGEVFEAEHVELEKNFAIKIPTDELLDDKLNLERFKREPKVAAATGHRCIVDVYDIGLTNQGIPFVVMEYLQGLTFGDLIERDSQVDTNLAIYVIAQVLSALTAAHAKGIIHRDLKPDNVYLVSTGQPLPEVKLLDFGTSKVVSGGSTNNSLTQSGTILGTPYYMAPEQIRANPKLDHRLDVYATGVMLYEALTGQVPFHSDNVYTLVHMVLHDELIAPSTYRSDITPELEAIILKAMERDRDERFDSAESMLRALLPFVDEMTRMRVWVPESLRSAEPPALDGDPRRSGFNTALGPRSSHGGLSDAGEISSELPLILGRYVALRRLGRGRTGTLYLGRTAEAGIIHHPVAIKRVFAHLTESKSAVRSFIKEAKLTQKVIHPNIIRLLDFGEHGGRYVSVAEYVHGYHLDVLAQFLASTRRPLALEHVIYIIYRVLQALAHAHSLPGDGGLLGLIHGDIAPHNIHISVDGQVKLTDFGLGRALTGAANEGTDRTKVNFAYMAPEQVNDEPVDQRTDLFSVGIVLYEMLTNQPLFGSGGDAITVMRVSKADVPDIRHVRPDLSPQVAQVIQTALARDPATRYQTAEAFASDIRELLGGAAPEELEPTFRTLVTQTVSEEGFRRNAGALFDLSVALKDQPVSLSDPTSLNIRQSADDDELQQAERPKSSSPLKLVIMIAVAIVVLGGGAVGAFIGLRDSGGSDTPQRPVAIIINQQNANAAPATPDANPSLPDATATATNDAGSASEDANAEGVNVVDARGPTKTPSKTPPRPLQPLTGRIVTQALMRQQARLRACFSRNEGAITAIRVVIASNGSVESASVEPAEVNATPLGRCVTQFARSTRFPRHPDRSVAFRVPARLSSQ